jgi:hypothetical protein
MSADLLCSARRMHFYFAVDKVAKPAGTVPQKRPHPTYLASTRWKQMLWNQLQLFAARPVTSVEAAVSLSPRGPNPYVLRIFHHRHRARRPGKKVQIVNVVSWTRDHR